MPKWSLTADQIKARPWGLPTRLLAPDKTITDPVHGDVHINRLERMFLDSAPMQRLRRIRQLGTSYLVYPGATHSRFSHALGALRAAQDLLDAIVDNRHGPRPHDDLLGEWPNTKGEGELVSEFDRRLAEVTVLARIGALLHDLCHVPYGHTIEDDLDILTAHDENIDRFDRLWAQLPDELAEALAKADKRFFKHLRPLIISKADHKELSPSGASTREDRQSADTENDELPSWYEYPFIADIVGNTICADLIDYLARDHMFTGLPVALGHRFADEFYVSRSDVPHYKRRMVISVTRNRQERPDIATELLKYLRFRYELSERVLYHHAKLAADAMIGKLLELWHDHEWAKAAIEAQPRLADDASDMTALRRQVTKRRGERLDAQIRRVMDDEFTRRSDDGLLEHLADLAAAGMANDSRLAGVHGLARAVLDRQLFKLAGRADDDAAQGLAERIHERFGSRDKRRSIEKRASTFIGLDVGWKVVVWIPSSTMKLKVAGVLVDRNGTVNALDKVGFDRATEIYNAHQKLWGVNVYVPAEVARNRMHTRRLLAFIGEELGVGFRDRHGELVERPAAVAAREVAEDRGLSATRTDELLELVDQRHIAAHGAEASPTFGALLQRVEQLADAEGFTRRSRTR